MRNLRSLSARKNIHSIAFLIGTFFLLSFTSLFTGCLAESEQYSPFIMGLNFDCYEMKTSYAVGDKLDLKGLHVYAFYSD